MESTGSHVKSPTKVKIEVLGRDARNRARIELLRKRVKGRNISAGWVGKGKGKRKNGTQKKEDKERRKE